MDPGAGIGDRPRAEATPSGADPDLRRAALRGTAWATTSRLTGRLLFFASTVILARLLEPEDFGVAGYALTMIALFGAIPGLGLAPALIHHREDPEILHTGFWLGVVAGVLGFAAVWLLAPVAGAVFADPRAVDVTRALALIFPIETLRNVHAALLRKRLAFRRRFVPEFIHALTKGGLAIGLALAGFGYWSLIWSTIAAAAVSVPAYWAAARWMPRLRFDRAAARRLMPFGGHVLAVDLLGALVRNLDYVLVGRMLGAATLGVYVLAFRIPDLLIRNVSTTVGQVLLPVYARVQADPAAIRETFLATTSYVFALTAPMAIGLALLSEPLVVTVFSEKWIDVVPVIPAICVYALCVSLSYNMGDLYKATGRPDVLSRLALMRAVLVVPALWFAAAVVGTAAAVGWAQAAVAGIAMLVNFAVAGLLFDMPIRRVLFRLAPVLGATAIMALVVLGLRTALPETSPPLELLFCSLAGLVAYGVALHLLAPEFLTSAVHAVADAMPRRRRSTPLQAAR